MYSTPEEKEDFLNFQAHKVPELRQEGDTILDDLNRQIEFIKGKSILSYHITRNTNEERYKKSWG